MACTMEYVALWNATGETAHLTADACKRASGGVLFIDEVL